MNADRMILRLGLLVLPAVTGCARVDPVADLRRVEVHVQSSTGAALPAPPADADEAERAIAERLAGGLTAAEALEICVLNNPRVRAAYLRVGVARADVVQAGLFRNPGLALSLRMPDGGGLSDLQLDFAQNVAELWLIPARRRAAEGELQREILAVAREIGVAALDTRAAYYTALAADREREIAAANRDVARELVDAAVARQTAGVGSEIDVNLARTEFMQTEIAVRTAELAAFEARRGLAVLLGLASPPESLTLSDALPDAPNWPLDPEALVRTASRARLDLVAASWLCGAAYARVEQERLSVVTDVELGVSFERMERGRRGDRPWLADTLWASAEAGRLAAPSLRPRDALPTNTVVGPALALELPIFDQNQAQIAKAEFLYEAATAQRDALRIDAAQETRAAVQRARTAWDVSNYYRESLLPLAERNVELTRAAYRSGKLALPSVLEAQQALLAARRQYAAALRDGAVAVTALEKAAGLPVERLVEESTGAGRDAE